MECVFLVSDAGARGVTATVGLTFLAPASGVIAGVLGGLGVLAFYFLKLRRRPVRVSSVAFWEAAASDLQVNAPWKMVRPSWILLMQLLGVALLAMALARPSTDRPVEAREVFIVIDRSASMSARDVGGGGGGASGGATRLEVAKREAVRLLERVPSDARVSVIAFAAEARSLVDGSSNRREVRRAIEGLRATDQPADAAVAFEVISALLGRGVAVDEGGEAEEEGPAPLVAIVSDGNFRAAVGGDGAGVGGERVGSVSLGRAEVRYVRAGPGGGGGGDAGVGGEAGANAGIVALAARRDYRDPALARVFARVRSNRGGAAGSVTLSATLGGRVVGTREVSFDANGEASHTFPVVSPTGGVVTVSIAGSEDALASDDAASTVLLAPERPSVLLVRGEGGAIGAGRASLRDALDALDTERVVELTALQARSRGLGGMADGTGAGEGDGGGFDVVVFDGVSPAREPGVGSISFDAAVPGGGVVLGDERSDRVVGFAYWRRDHPVMRAVSLSDVVVEGPREMRFAGEAGGADGVAGDGGGRALELASGERGALIAFSERDGVGRITVAFGLDRTNWWRFPGFPLFVANAVEHLGLRAGAVGGLSFTTGEAVRLSVPRGLAGARLSLSGGGDSSLSLAVGPGGAASGGPAERAGVYEVSVEDGGGAAVAGVPAAVAVNLLSERESSLASPGGISVGGSEAAGSGAAGVAPEEVWHWFVLGAFAVFVLEWLLFAKRMAG